MPIRQLTIIGTGLIGGSFGLALKKHRFLGRIGGCDRAPIRERAREKGAIDRGYTDPVEAVRGSQVVLLATPVGGIIDLMERIESVLPARTLLTAVGSKKVEVVARAGAVFGKNAGRRFLPGHPMAGKEQSGVEVADAGVCQGATWFFTPLNSQDVHERRDVEVVEGG